MIKQYIKGFFSSFQLYLDKSTIERKVSLNGSEISIVSYVHRPLPKGASTKSYGHKGKRLSSSKDRAKPNYFNPKEKQLHQGLLQG